MRLHNFGTVVAFELRRTLLKPSFWAASLSVPLLLAVVLGLSVFSNLVAAQQSVDNESRPVAFTYADASGIVVPDVAAALGGTPAPDAAAAADAVRQGRGELHVDVPADPAADPVRVVGRDLGLLDSGRWETVGARLVTESATARIGDPRLARLTGDIAVVSELYKDGRRSAGWLGAIAPAAFLVLLYMAIIMLGQQMLNITVEEKENRVTEMILTTIHPSLLIVGKVVALLLVGLVQGVVFMTPLLVWTLASGSAAGTSPSLGGLVPVVDAGAVALGAALFVGGFLLFTGLLVAIGAVMPTAKEAGNAFGAVMLSMFLPLYAFALVIGSPEAPVTQALTYFPLTAPVTALMRNAAGTLSLVEAAIVLVVLYGCAAGFLAVGVRMFREGSISYDSKLNPLRVLRRRRPPPVGGQPADEGVHGP